ncbi:MAG: thymidylate synthase [Sodalinema sp.]|uniref:thymidylate synthase n=1 Tax=Sodalinema sp. TaxID=3080550 RepID=UPI00396F3935
MPHPYQPHYKPNQLICGTGTTAIVSGWTVKEAIAKHLQPQDYAVIGQLYSPTRGISVLVRNLLLNPQVRDLIIVDATREDRNAGSGRCLADFFAQGVRPGQTESGRDCWVINSPIVGYLDAELPEAAIATLRESITCHRVEDVKSALHLARTIAQQPSPKPWGVPQSFPEAIVESPLKPGRRYGHRLEGRTIAETWVKLIHRIRRTGTLRNTQHDSQWQELINLMAIVTDEPPEFYFPDPNYLPVSRDFVADYVGQIQDDAVSKDGVKYTYGQRLRSWFGVDQIQQVVQQLRDNPDSARAVMSLWDAQQDGQANGSPPCLNHIWTRIVDGELSLTATFRSNDMFGAWVANAMGLRALQQHLRETLEVQAGLNLDLGPLITISESAHIYDDCWENADTLIEQQYPKLLKNRSFADPSGSFTILISGRTGEIVVEHLTPGSGEPVGCYVGKTAKRLYQTIAADCPVLETEHALYLGTELQKAEISLKLELEYQQDKPLSQRIGV